MSWLSVGLAAGVNLVAAQTPSSPDEATAGGMRLDDALSHALEANFSIRRARAILDAARGREEHSSRWLPSNPQLGLETTRREDQVTGQDEDGLGIRLAQEFWIGGQGGLMEAAGTARRLGARAELEFLVTSVRARTRAAFLELLIAQEAVETAQRAVTVASDLQTYATARVEAGEATRLELNTAEIGVGRARAALAQAKESRERARLSLAALLSRDPVAPLRVTGRLISRELALPGQKELLDRSARRRADLRAAAQEVVASRNELQLSRRKLVPNLKLFGFYEEEGAEDVSGIGLSIPLPTSHRYQGERMEAAAELEMARIEESALRLQVRQEVLGALAGFRAARERFDAVSGQMLDAAEENVRLTYEAFRAGKVGAQAIAASQESLLEVRESYLNAQRSMVSAASELERATGGLLVVTDTDGAPAR